MNPQVFLLATFLVALTGSSVNGKLITLCDSPHGTVQSVSISTCKDTDSYCVLQKNTNASIEVNFVPSKFFVFLIFLKPSLTNLIFLHTDYAATSVTTKIIGEVVGVPMPFPINPKEACGNYGLNCPLTVSGKSQFKLELPIKSAYPSVSVTVTIKLVDDSNTNLVCLQFNAQITG